MKFLDFIKEKLKKINLSNKTTTNLVILLCLGISLIIVGDFYKNLTQNKVSKDIIEEQTEAKSSDSDYVSQLENELNIILSKIQSAGRVSVMITLNSSSELIPAKDKSSSNRIIDEKDTEGGTRITNEINTDDKVVFQNKEGGGSLPLVLKEMKPKIQGVIVVADGAKDAKVKLKLSKAVQTVLNVPAYKVTVLERN